MLRRNTKSRLDDENVKPLASYCSEELARNSRSISSGLTPPTTRRVGALSSRETHHRRIIAGRLCCADQRADHGAHKTRSRANPARCRRVLSRSGASMSRRIPECRDLRRVQFILMRGWEFDWGKCSGEGFEALPFSGINDDMGQPCPFPTSQQEPMILSINHHPSALCPIQTRFEHWIKKLGCAFPASRPTAS